MFDCRRPAGAQARRPMPHATSAHGSLKTSDSIDRSTGTAQVDRTVVIFAFKWRSERDYFSTPTFAYIVYKNKNFKRGGEESGAIRRYLALSGVIQRYLALSSAIQHYLALSNTIHEKNRPDTRLGVREAGSRLYYHQHPAKPDEPRPPRAVS